VVDQRELLAPAPLDMQVERVEAGVEPAAREPAVERLARVIEDRVPAPLPVDVLGRGRPEAFGIPHGPLIDLLVDARHHLDPPRVLVPRGVAVPLGVAVPRGVVVPRGVAAPGALRLTHRRPKTDTMTPARLTIWGTR